MNKTVGLILPKEDTWTMPKIDGFKFADYNSIWENKQTIESVDPDTNTLVITKSYIYYNS